MNEHDSLDETLGRFREIVPPACVRLANRAAVRQALQSSSPKPWWRRTIIVPLPLALATAALLLISLSTHLIAGRGNATIAEPDVSVEPSGGGNTDATLLVAASDPHAEYFETQRYLSGIGVVDRRIFYQFKE